MKIQTENPTNSEFEVLQPRTTSPFLIQNIKKYQENSPNLDLVLDNILFNLDVIKKQIKI